MAETQDHSLATELATKVGERLVELREELFQAGTSSWHVGDIGDMEAHRLIVETLERERPDDGLLSEEGHDDQARLEKQRVWIIDPLDGTNEYSVRGRSDWAVHIALVEDGAPTAGAVALPALGMTFGTQPAPRLAERSTEGESSSKPRIVVSRSRPSGAAMVLKRAFDGELIPMGSAGAKAMAVVMGVADIYAHSGGQYEWDNCAPAAVALAAGLHASRCDGSPLDYNYADPWLPDLLICREELAQEALEALRHETMRRW